MQRRMSHRIPGLLFILAALALSVAWWSPAAANEIVIAVWTSPEAENLKRAAPVIAQKTGLRVEIDEIARDAYRSKVSTTLLSKAPAWDVVWLPRCAGARGSRGAVVLFAVQVRNDNRGRTPPLVRLKAVCGPGDGGEPVSTIMLPGEE